MPKEPDSKVLFHRVEDDCPGMAGAVVGAETVEDAGGGARLRRGQNQIMCPSINARRGRQGRPSR
jgi:hypothetical protein